MIQYRCCRREGSFCGSRCLHQTLQIWLPCHCQDQTVPCNSRCPSMLTQEPPQSFFFRIWHSTPISELLFYKARLLNCQCSFATRARHASLRILQSAIIVMPGYISRSLNVSHSSGTKVIELCLEIVDSIPKPLRLQGIWVHSKGTLGFRLWFHHYPSHFLLSLCLPFFVPVSSRKVVES